MKRSWTSALVVAFASLSCANPDARPTIHYIPTNTPPATMSARTFESVEVLTAPPQKPYVEVAVIEVRANNDYMAQTEHLMYWLRRRGSEAGCDAVMIMGSADVVTGTTMGAYSNRTTYRGLRGTCVVYPKSYVAK